MKVPDWFVIETPVGGYNPDWAIVKQQDDETPMVVLVRETKGTLGQSRLREIEVLKMHCGLKHFSTLGVDYGVAVSADSV